MSDKYQKAIDTAKADQVGDAGLLYREELPRNIQSLTSNFYFNELGVRMKRLG